LHGQAHDEGSYEDVDEAAGKLVDAVVFDRAFDGETHGLHGEDREGAHERASLRRR